MKIKFWLLSILSGLLFAFSWPAIGDQWYLIFFAFLPLLWIEREYAQLNVKRKALKVYGFAYLSFFIFNLLTTYWIYYASDWGMAMAVICNSFFMAAVFTLFRYSKRWVGERQGYIGFIFLWIAFEYLHLNWELSWTWLTLGNVFANDVQFVQWYEYTGVLGGSLLILVVNLLLFSALVRFFEQKNQSPQNSKPTLKTVLPLALTLTLLLISWLYSSSRYRNYQADGEKAQIVVIQPNIDPYKEKFYGMAESDQIDRMVQLSLSQVDEETDLLAWPETAFPQAYWEHEFEYLYGTEEVRKIIDSFPQLRVITGLSSSRLFLEGDVLTKTARKFRQGEGWYDNYNSAIEIEAGKKIDLHHKSKLVLGVEKIPFLQYLPIMKKLSINLGGSSGGLGEDGSPTVFFNDDSEDGFAPIICYESIYGEYVTEYVRQGAQLLVIITNDGWWDNTPGYKQHLAYARLRAIETRRSIARSANTGISAFIDQKGELLQATDWWVEAAIKAELYLNNEQTFYVRYGDFTGRIAGFVAPLFLLLAWVKSRNKTEQRLKL
ncbi:MAG: apolipoprotein N-acyltransferase [Flavobacteriales bacterium]|nr:apolipoprotein N-acyltransferase [Flavobacteriales bacterium]